MGVDLKALGLDEPAGDPKQEPINTETPAASWLTDAQRAELRRRIADSDANPDDHVPWEEVQASIRKRLGR